MSASEQIKKIRKRIIREFLPLIAQGKIEFAPVNKIISLYQRYETLLDLNDGENLIKYAPMKSQRIQHPSELSPYAQQIDFENFSPGKQCPVTDGFATIYCERSSRVRLSDKSWQAKPKIVEGNLLGYSRSSYTLAFEEPVREFGIGLFDVNFGGVMVQLIDKDGRGIRQALSKRDFPVGPSDGKTATFIGFKLTDPKISTIRIKTKEKIAIDNVFYKR